MIVLMISFKTGRFTRTCLSSLLSSVLIIGKSGAESHLTFGSENLLAQTGWRGLLKKLKLLAIYAPVFIATTSSRLTALAVVFTWGSGTGAFVFLPLSLGTPILLFLSSKFWALKDLSVLDISRAVLGEQTTHSLWGGRGRERSKKLQLVLQVYFLLLHSVFMVLVLSGVQPVFGRERPEVLVVLEVLASSVEPTNHEKPDAPTLERLQAGSIVSLVSGWSSGVVLTLNVCFYSTPFGG